MTISRFRLITFLALSLLALVAVVVFGSWYAPAFGDAGLRLQHYPIRLPLASIPPKTTYLSRNTWTGCGQQAAKSRYFLPIGRLGVRPRIAF